MSLMPSCQHKCCGILNDDNELRIRVRAALARCVPASAVDYHAIGGRSGRSIGRRAAEWSSGIIRGSRGSSDSRGGGGGRAITNAAATTAAALPAASSATSTAGKILNIIFLCLRYFEILLIQQIFRPQNFLECNFFLQHRLKRLY